MNNIELLFFATLKEMAGARKVTFQIEEGATVADLKEKLSGAFPKIEPYLATVLVSVNKEYAASDEVIPAGAEVALFPPVSGGEDLPTFFAVTEDEIDLNVLVARITRPTTGAACVFTGMVRADTRRGEARQTDYLEYEAYVPMAEEKMRQVAGEIRERWPSVEGIAIVQRIGRLFPGTPTVLIACTAGHRDTGVFEASRYGIDRLKEIVPIWKKEIGPEGQEWVEGSYFPAAGE